MTAKILCTTLISVTVLVIIHCKTCHFISHREEQFPNGFISCVFSGVMVWKYGIFKKIFILCFYASRSLLCVIYSFLFVVSILYFRITFKSDCDVFCLLQVSVLWSSGCCGGRCLGNVLSGNCICLHFLLGLCTQTTKWPDSVDVVSVRPFGDSFPKIFDGYHWNLVLVVCGVGVRSSFIFVHIAGIYWHCLHFARNSSRPLSNI